MKSERFLNFSKTKTLTGIILGCLLIAVPCLAGGPTVGDTAPDFSSLSTSGRFFDLSGIEGKTVLLSFWSDLVFIGATGTDLPEESKRSLSGGCNRHSGLGTRNSKHQVLDKDRKLSCRVGYQCEDSRRQGP